MISVNVRDSIQGTEGSNRIIRPDAFASGTDVRKSGGSGRKGRPWLEEAVPSGGGRRFEAVRCTRLGPETLEVEVGREVVLVA